MDYPKPLMSIKELADMGFSKTYLYEMAHQRGQKFATTTTGGGKFIFDTAKFEKERTKAR